MPQETLQALLEESKKQTLALRLCLGFCGVLCLLAVIVVWQVLPLLAQASLVLTQLQQLSDRLAALNIEQLVENLNALALDSQQSVALAADAVKAIDIATLNKAITDLESVIAPMADFVNRFRF